jgi:carbonic anhydrase/acetyltransferase-like protein (isoleucine patch superfamily)
VTDDADGIVPFGEAAPRLHGSVLVAGGARVVGDVEIGEGSSVWFNAVIRGDTSFVRIGARTNVQDGAVVHTDTGKPCAIGDDCTVGHLAIVHGCTIGNGCLIGMGAVVLSGAVIGDGSIVGAGSVVPEGTEFQPGSLLVGSPAKRIRGLTDEDLERLVRPGVRTYLRLAEWYRAPASTSERAAPDALDGGMS